MLTDIQVTALYFDDIDDGLLSMYLPATVNMSDEKDTNSCSNLQFDAGYDKDESISGSENSNHLEDEWTSNTDPDWLPLETTKRKMETSASNQDILPKKTSKTIKKFALTEEEKRHRRKELNRIAAQRCRQKRKSRADVLEKEAAVLIEKNAELKQQIEQITEIKEELYDIIKFHFQTCQNKK